MSSERNTCYKWNLNNDLNYKYVFMKILSTKKIYKCDYSKTLVFHSSYL
jgi:hypothetical protein